MFYKIDTYSLPIFKKLFPKFPIPDDIDDTYYVRLGCRASHDGFEIEFSPSADEWEYIN